MHALKVRVETPAGQPAAWFDRSLIIGAAGTDIRLPIAFNEQSGKWKVEVSDLYTGKSTDATFEVVR